MITDKTPSTNPMRASILLLLLLAACGEPPSLEVDGGRDAGSSGDAGTMLTADQQEWITAHNTVRAAAMPVPSPALNDVHWDPSAATLATDWAARCNFMHNDSSSLGENIYAATSSQTPTSIVGAWAAEKSDYTHATNTCAAGRVCGHYTQIVWRSSTGIGCAQKMCSSGSPFGAGAWFFTVCNYAPAGNFVGQRPY